MKEIEKLKSALKETITVCGENVSRADNIDLVDMAQTLESYLDELNEIGDFETYDDED